MALGSPLLLTASLVLVIKAPVLETIPPDDSGPPRWPSGYGAGLENGRPGSVSRFLRGDFSGSSHISDLQISTPVATLPGARRDRVSAGNGWPGVSIL